MKRKNQGMIQDIYFNEFRNLNIKTPPKSELPLGGLVKGGLTVLISVFIIFTVVKASTLKITPPSGAPAATFYSLSEIYNFIASSTPATAGSPALDWSTPLEDTGRTLTEIYNALANLISADKVKEGTTYLGVTGAYTGSGFTFGSSSPAGVLTSPATPATGGTFVAANLSNYLIATGTAWGVGQVGTLLGHLYTGSAGTLVLTNTLFPLDNFTSLVPNNTDLGFFGGVDDWNNAGTIPVGSYTGGWYGAAGSCNIGNHYCGAGDTAVSADNKDLSTGLVWSTTVDSGTVHTWFWANNCYEPLTLTYNPIKCTATGDIGCQCVKKPSGSKVGCEALDSTGGNTLGPWRTPTQKELMQVYIDGSWQYLSSPANANGYWSATTGSSATQGGYLVNLQTGTTASFSKTSTSGTKLVRCVH